MMPKTNPIKLALKKLRFMGDSHKRIQALSDIAQSQLGYELEKVQRGEEPSDWKPMPSIGQGVREIRVWNERGTYRAIYTAQLADAVYVLHVFQKKTQNTAKRDINLARARWLDVMEDLR